VTCYRPMDAWAPLDGGPISFSEIKDSREIRLKCGNCLGCRLERRDMWALRCYCESKMHRDNCFITLTYDDEHLPMHGSLCYRDFQLFMMRLRKRCGSGIRFFMCGEYGENFDRPHFHALLFGHRFDDITPANGVFSHSRCYRSETLEKLWTKGFSTVGEVTFASARYTAAYCVKKVTGPLAEEHYKRVDTRTGEIVTVTPEFAHMSLKPGIGFTYLEKYWRDMYMTGHNAVIVDGKKKKIPRYFDKRMDDLLPLFMDDIEFQRQLAAEPFAVDNTRERLQVREIVESARVKFEKSKQTGVSL
jgi:hypothetical protein